MEGHVVTFLVKSADDLDVILSHHKLTEISFVELGLEFSSERTCNLDLPLNMLLSLALQDIRDNAQQMVGAVEKTRDLGTFLDQLDALSSVFPWTLKMTCPMALARVDAEDVTIERFLIAEEDVERVSGAYAEIAFAQADLDEEEAEEAAREAEAAAAAVAAAGH